MTCAISVGDKRDVDHIVGFLFLRVGKKRCATGWYAARGPASCCAGVRMRSPGLVPEKRNEAGAGARREAYPAQVARAYFEADSRSASRVILRAKP